MSYKLRNRSWKDNSKRRRQYKRVANITIEPGYSIVIKSYPLVKDESGHNTIDYSRPESHVIIIPFDEHTTYAKE